MVELTILLLIVGVLLLVVEMFIPGFGVAGLLGLAALFGAVLLQIGNTAGMLFMAALVLFIIAVGLIVFFRLASNGKFDKLRIILNDQIEGESTDTGGDEMRSFVGREGTALTPLRPSGKAVFGEKTFDVVSEGEFMESGSKVEIIAVEGLRVIVRAASEASYNAEM